MLKLREATQRGDNKRIISCLIELRKSSKGTDIDRNTIELLIDLIKVPNTKIINYSLSILANCCLNNSYRVMFKEMGGVSHLLLVVRSIDDDNIICRACRLIGNLALNNDLARELCKCDAGIILIDLLEKNDSLSPATLIMVFRAIKKLWAVAENKWKMSGDVFPLTLSKYLSSEDEQVVCETLKSLFNFTLRKNVPKNERLQVTKELFLKIILLSQKEKFNSLALSCLSNLISNHTSDIWNYLEGSNVAEVYIDYIKKTEVIQKNVYKAFYTLCREGAIRNKVRIAGILPKLIEICNKTNIREFLVTLYLFQYDLVSMTVCSQNPKFTSLLIDNVLLPGAIPLLAVLSRLDPPVKELVNHRNLDVIIQNKQCSGILKNITRTRQFLQPILTSGKVWEIEKAGCSMEEIGSLEHSEGLITHLLCSGEKKCREDVSLAVPFLVKPRNFEQLYKLLAHYQVISTILNLLKENPVEERILASILRLIHIFKYNYHQSDDFFKDFGDSSKTITPMELCTDEFSDNSQGVPNGGLDENNSSTELVTFELDNGSCVAVNKNLLCKNSPVFDSMLNGHFMEANQERVRLRRFSKEALLHLVKLLNNELALSDIKIDIYLELLSLTDRFLFISLNNVLTEKLKIDASSCSLAYQWYRKAGHTKNNSVIRQKIYEFLFSSTDYLVIAMKDDLCRAPLIKEITNYLSNSLIDLL